jgi:hypothetical protein
MKLRLILAVSAVLLSSLAVAQPSTYFLWKNKTTNATVCEPQMDEAQWVQQSGPYEDSNCKFLAPT